VSLLPSLSLLLFSHVYVLIIIRNQHLHIRKIGAPIDKGRRGVSLREKLKCDENENDSEHDMFFHNTGDVYLRAFLHQPYREKLYNAEFRPASLFLNTPTSRD
jgi:hypothetical protein